MVSGCAGTETARELRRTYGEMSLRSSERPGVDYVVSIRNLVDIGYNPDNPETRHSEAAAMVRKQCPGAHVVGEKVINTGTYITGRGAKTYEIDVKC